MTGLTPYLPMLIAVCGAVVSMLVGAWGHRAVAVWTGVAGLAAGAALAAARLTPAHPAEVVGRIDPILVAACLGITALVLAGTHRLLAETDDGVRVAALGTLAGAASALVATSHDVVVLFLAVETLALLGYGLVALAGTDRAREAAMKWFVQGSIATAVFIAGLAVLIGVSGGNVTYVGIGAAGLAHGPAITVGWVLVLAALLFKAGAFPFHSWMPDAFETASPAAAAILASAGKIGPIAAITYVIATCPDAIRAHLVPLVAAVALGSIIFGNLAALRQRNFGRMLAYSGVAQVGYAMVGLVLAQGVLATLLFGIVYALAAATAFLVAFAVRELRPEWDGSVSGLAGLSASAPLPAAALAVAMFSLTGIPLTAGFWAKFAVFSVAVTGNYLWLVVAGMVGSVVSFGYYGAVLRSAYMVEAVPAPEGGPGRPIPRMALTVLCLLALVIVAAGVAPFILGLTSLTAIFV